jgi:ubiquinone/menaquinone biosynthesis C-methylase UbiE
MVKMLPRFEEALIQNSEGPYFFPAMYGRPKAVAGRFIPRGVARLCTRGSRDGILSSGLVAGGEIGMVDGQVEQHKRVQADFPLYGNIASLYDTALSVFGFSRGIRRFFSRIDVGPTPPKRILDAGCGTGPISFSLLRRFPTAEIVAFDLDPQMLYRMAWRAAHKRVPTACLTLARGDLESPDRLRHYPDRKPLRLPAESFQLIVVGAALEHVRLDRALPGLFRLLAPGGIFLNLGVRRSAATAILGRIYRFTPHEPELLRQAISLAGFSAVRSESLSPRDFPVNLTRLATFAQKS